MPILKETEDGRGGVRGGKAGKIQSKSKILKNLMTG
jgi:hypothetical protein